MNKINKTLLAFLFAATLLGGYAMYKYAPQAFADTPISGYFLSASQYTSHTPIAGPGTYSLLVDSMNNLRVAENFTYNSGVINITNSTTTLKTGTGLLHSVTADTVASGTVFTLYDDSSTVILPTAYASATILFGPSSSATTTATGTFSAVINGFTVTSAQVSNGSTSVQAATAMTTAINASSSLLNFITATSNSNTVTLIASQPNVRGNFSLSITNPQLGLTPTVSSTPANGTPIIAQITTNGSVPVSLIYDTAFNSGLLVTESGPTSTFTISSE